MHDDSAFDKEQEVPHDTQSEFVFKGVSHPLLSIESQFPQLALQLDTLHVPVKHEDDIMFGREQIASHAPQSLRVVIGRSHPFDAIPSQLSHPELHERI